MLKINEGEIIQYNQSKGGERTFLALFMTPPQHDIANKKKILEEMPENEMSQ
jgi:hypothetical protein